MGRISNYEAFVEDFKSYYGIEPPKGAREFFITKEFEYSKEDFSFVVVSILDEILSEIQQQLFSYISIPKNHNEIVSIDYEYIQQRKKEIYTNYSLCIDYKRKIAAKKVKKSYEINKEFMEDFITNIDSLGEFCSNFILELNDNFQKEIKKVGENKKQNVTGNMYV